MTATLKSKSLGPFVLGMDNRRRDFDLDQGRDGTALRDAVNVDVTKEGRIKRRGGSQLKINGSAVHSLWGADGQTAYFVDGTTLHRLNATMQRKALRTNVPAGQLLSYARLNDDVYYSDGLELRRIHGDTEQPAGVPPLLSEPEATTVAGGALPPGRYTFCCTYSAADGEEGGSTAPVQIEVAQGGLRIDLLPTSWPAGVVALNIYMSLPNSAELLRLTSLAAPQGSYTLTSLPVLGRRCPTLLLARMPGGQLVRYLNGRLFVANGNTLFYSEAYAPTLFNPARNYIPLPSRITMLEPCENGMFIGSDQTYWLAGDVLTAELKSVLPYGAVYGASGQVPHEHACWWMSERGLVKGTDDGTATNLQDTQVAVEAAHSGAGLFRERDGMKQALAALFNTEPNRVSAKSWLDAEVIRKGTVL